MKIQRLRNIIKHQGIRRYAVNTVWMFAEQMLRIIAGLFVGIWVARFLGPEQFGFFSYVTTFAAMFGVIASLGLNNILVRDLVNNPEKIDAYLGTAFWLKLMGAFITLGIIGITLLFASSDATTNLYIFIVAGGLVFQSFEVIEFYFQSKVLSKFVSLCKITQLFLSSLIKIYLIYIGAGLFWFVLVSLIDQITLGITLFITYRLHKGKSFYRRFNFTLAKQLLKDSLLMMLYGLAIAAQAGIDQIMLKQMLGSEELGYYSAAVKLFAFLAFMPVIINTSISPAITNAKKISHEFYFKRLQKNYTLMFILFIVSALPIWFFGNYFVVLLYGAKFAPAGPLFSLMAIRVLLLNFGVARGQFITNEGLFTFSLIAALIGAGLNIGLNYFFIPLYGAKGAIGALYISMFVTTFAVDIFNKKMRSNLYLMFLGIFKPLEGFRTQETVLTNVAK